MTDTYALTLWQPWASLVALGVKALDRVRDLHRGVEVSDELEFDGLLCAACSTPWPCATRQAIREVTGG